MRCITFGFQTVLQRNSHALSNLLKNVFIATFRCQTFTRQMVSKLDIKTLVIFLVMITKRKMTIQYSQLHHKLDRCDETVAFKQAISMIRSDSFFWYGILWVGRVQGQHYCQLISGLLCNDPQIASVDGVELHRQTAVIPLCNKNKNILGKVIEITSRTVLLAKQYLRILH